MGTLKGEKRQGETRLSTNNGIPVFEDVYHFTVIADSDNESYASLRNTAGLPVVGSAFSGSAVCRSLVGTQRDGSRVWDFVAEFSSEVGENTENPDNADPNTWTPVYQTRFERISEIVTDDASGNPIVNSAGQPFENGITMQRSIPIWTFAQFEPATVTDEDIIERHETVNETEFKGRAAKTLKLIVEQSVIGYYYGARRRLTTYSLKYNKKKWTLRPIDKGTAYKKNGKTISYITRLNEDSCEVGGVIVGGLDGSGEPAGGFDSCGFPVDGTPAKLEFDQFPVLEFKDFLRG